MEIQAVIKDLQYKVLVRCMTYNQSRYIVDALNGFAIQQTSFPFVCLAMDDASTDGEQDVIRSFLDSECDMEHSSRYEIEEANVVISQHKINKNCTFAVYFLKTNLFGSPQKLKLNDEWRKYCKYEALCEGDDYWISPNKLQIQYDALEAHPECTICFNRVQALRADNGKNEFLIPRSECVFGEGKVTLKDLAEEEFKLGNWCFHTSSFFFRREIGLGISSFQRTYLPSFPYGDMPLQMYALLQGDGFFIGEKMGCYRLLSGGWNSNMVQNPELNKQMMRRVIAGFKEFDKYTKYRFHEYVRAHNLRKEYFNLYDSRPHNLKYLSFNMPHYISSVKSFFKKKNPRLYRRLKTLISNNE